MVEKVQSTCIGILSQLVSQPHNCRSSEILFGVFISLIDLSAMMPCSLMMSPRNFMLFCRKEHFALFKVTPAASIHSSTTASHVSCSTFFFPWTKLTHNSFQEFGHLSLKVLWSACNAKGQLIETKSAIKCS